MPADNMRRIELLVIKDEPSTKTPGSGKRLSVVQWAKDGKSVSVQLIQADYWINDNNRETYFKAKGIGLTGLLACNPRWKEIAELMKNPPAIVEPAKASTEQPPQEASSEIEEVPF